PGQDGIQLRLRKIRRPEEYLAIGSSNPGCWGRTLDRDRDEFEARPYPLDEIAIVGQLTVDVDRPLTAPGLSQNGGRRLGALLLGAGSVIGGERLNHQRELRQNADTGDDAAPPVHRVADER